MQGCKLSYPVGAGDELRGGCCTMVPYRQVADLDGVFYRQTLTGQLESQRILRVAERERPGPEVEGMKGLVS